MKLPYIKIYAADLLAASRHLTSQQIGDMVLGICEDAFEQHTTYQPQGEREEAFFAMLSQWKDESKTLYCQKSNRAKKAAQKRWSKKQVSDGACCISTPQCQTETKPETKPETENINTLTAQPVAAQGACEKNLLQEFAARVAQRFEPDVQTPVQREIWFKRNARCLRDIYQFCDRNITLALQTISVCANRLSKAGLTGGYEAVCRNLPEYYARAKSQEEQPHAG